MINGLTFNDIKDIANGNAKYNRFVSNLDKDELLEELATIVVEKAEYEDIADDLSNNCDKLLDCIGDLDWLADDNDKLVKISERLDKVHTNLCKLKDYLEELNQ